jgi:acyl dehydratase
MANRKSASTLGGTGEPTFDLAAPPSALVTLARAGLSGLRTPPATPLIPEWSAQMRNIAPDRSRVRAYSLVCGFDTNGPLPLTYPHVIGGALQLWLMSRPGFPLPMLGLVHLSNRCEQRRAIARDEALDYTVRFAGSRSTDRGLEFDMATVCTDRAGRVVWEGLSTYLRRSGKSAGAKKSAAEPLPRYRNKQSFKAHSGIGRAYARVSGDYNPIHLTALSARLFGFPRAIAHGMWTAAHCLALMQMDGRRTPASLEVRFRKPVLLPANVELRNEAGTKQSKFILAGRDEVLHCDGIVRWL